MYLNKRSLKLYKTSLEDFFQLCRERKWKQRLQLQDVQPNHRRKENTTKAAAMKTSECMILTALRETEANKNYLLILLLLLHWWTLHRWLHLQHSRNSRSCLFRCIIFNSVKYDGSICMRINPYKNRSPCEMSVYFLLLPYLCVRSSLCWPCPHSKTPPGFHHQSLKWQKCD